MLVFLIGFVAGVIVTGVVAHNKPEWFSDIVAKVAKLESKVEDKMKN